MAAGITGLAQTAVAALVPSASEPVLESKWHQPFSEPVRQRIAPQLAVALIASGLTYVNAGPFPESVTEGRWHQPWSEPVRVRPALPAGEQHVFEFEPAPIVSIGWYAALAEPVRLKPGLPAGLQQVFAPDPFPKVSFSWWNWLAEPVRVRPALPAGEQQVSPFDEDIVFVDRWFQPLSEPARVRPAVLVPATEQQFEPFDEDIIFVDRWFAWWSEPVRVKPALGTGSHQVLAFDSLPLPFLGGGGGWYLPDPTRPPSDPSSSESPRRIARKGAPRQVEPAIAPPTFADVIWSQQPARLADVLGSAFAPQLVQLHPPALDLYRPPSSALRASEGRPAQAPSAATVDAIADHVDAMDAMEALQALDELDRQEREAAIAFLVRIANSEEGE
jgi:hypothetical protein